MMTAGFDYPESVLARAREIYLASVEGETFVAVVRRTGLAAKRVRNLALIGLMQAIRGLGEDEASTVTRVAEMLVWTGLTEARAVALLGEGD